MGANLEEKEADVAVRNRTECISDLTVSSKGGIVMSCLNRSINHSALRMTVLQCLIIIPRS